MANTSLWNDAANSGRRWVVAAGGLGFLACLALAGAAARTLSPESPEWACGSAFECNQLGAFHSLAVDAKPADLVLAARLFQQGCERGHAPACNNLGLAYQNAHGVPLDYARAIDSFERACGSGFAEGCSNQGALYEHGRGVQVNLGDAQRLYLQACRRGSALGCSNLGVLYAEGRGMARDEGAAARLFAEACRAGSTVACTNLFATEQPSTSEPIER